MVRREHWVFSGDAARQLISGDGAVAAQLSTSRQSEPDGRQWEPCRTSQANMHAEEACARLPRQKHYEDGSLGARKRFGETLTAMAEHREQDREPNSRTHGFGRPAAAQRSGGRHSKEALLTERQQQQLATVNRTPRASKEVLRPERHQQQLAAVSRTPRASKEMMQTERKERMCAIELTTEDYEYTERHLSPRQKHYNSMARVDAQQAKRFGLQATPYGLHGFGEKPGSQTTRGRAGGHEVAPGQPNQPDVERASHDKREDDAGRCADRPGPPCLPPRSTSAAVAAAAARAVPTPFLCITWPQRTVLCRPPLSESTPKPPPHPLSPLVPPQPLRLPTQGQAAEPSCGAAWVRQRDTAAVAVPHVHYGGCRGVEWCARPRHPRALLAHAAMGHRCHR